MLRPATPLTIVLVLAFGLLLIATLSTPIISKVPLGSFGGVDFGVFGFCNAGGCSKIKIGYDGSQAFQGEQSSDFDLPVSTRSTLSAILVVHPIAAFLTLIFLGLAGASHVHSPSHSARYLLLLFIVSIIDFLVCLLAFLVDILVFVPHMAFGTWLVLAATILVAFAMVISCAMRRTIVNRKARKKRIAENAEMSGENYYNRQAHETTMPVAAPTMPVMAGANGAPSEKPSFATFENKTGRTSDERIPLTARSPSNRSPNEIPGDGAGMDAMYNGAPQRTPSAPRDQYGNPQMGGPQDAYGSAMRRPSQDRMGRGRGGMSPGPRGRGGYGPRGGAYGQYPPQGGRGGYGGPGRGGYGPQGGRGGYGPPSRGYAAGGMMRGGRGGQGGPGYGQGPYDRRDMSAPYGNASTPSFNTQQSAGPNGSYEQFTPSAESELPRAESPPPLPGVEHENAGLPGQAIPMDERTGSPAHPPANFGNFRESDADIAGMVGLQQGRAHLDRHNTYMSETSKYSQDEGQYMPARQAWATGSNTGAPDNRIPSPLRPGHVNTPPSQPAAGHNRQSSDTYYEDVDARFAEPEPAAAMPPRSPPQRQHPMAPPQPPPLQTSNSYEDIRDLPPGARSPAESERSNFTSISQRGINPRWNPRDAAPMPSGPSYGGGGMMPPPRRPLNPRPKDMVLDSNPDFQLPGSRGNQNARQPGGGMIPGSAYPGGAM